MHTSREMRKLYFFEFEMSLKSVLSKQVDMGQPSKWSEATRLLILKAMIKVEKEILDDSVRGSRPSSGESTIYCLRKWRKRNGTKQRDNTSSARVFYIFGVYLSYTESAGHLNALKI